MTQIHYVCLVCACILLTACAGRAVAPSMESSNLPLTEAAILASPKGRKLLDGKEIKFRARVVPVPRSPRVGFILSPRESNAGDEIFLALYTVDGQENAWKIAKSRGRLVEIEGVYSFTTVTLGTGSHPYGMIEKAKFLRTIAEPVSSQSR